MLYDQIVAYVRAASGTGLVPALLLLLLSSLLLSVSSLLLPRVGVGVVVRVVVVGAVKVIVVVCFCYLHQRTFSLRSTKWTCSTTNVP